MTFSVYEDIQAVPVPNEDYARYVMSLLSSATSRVWISMFIVNPVVEQDPGGVVRAFLKGLAYAVWRGVDVRLVIGNSATPAIFIANATAVQYCQHLGIPIRRFKGDTRRSLHSKYVLVDEQTILLGSHNWTNSASTANVEDSIFIDSLDFGRLLSAEHENIWNRSGGESDDA